MSFVKMDLEEFSERLAAKDAVPGGGGVSALVASLGASLASMVGNLTVGKAKYAPYETQVQAIMDSARELQRQLLALIDADAEAFAPLAKVYAIPKETLGREELMEQALAEAARVPMEILRCAAKGIDLHAQLTDKCSVLAVSDVATGVAMCRAALYGAAVNVRVNTRLMKNRAYADELDREAERLLNTYGKIADGVYEQVWETLS